MLIQGIKKHWAKAAVLVTAGSAAAYGVVSKDPVFMGYAFAIAAPFVGYWTAKKWPLPYFKNYETEKEKISARPSFRRLPTKKTQPGING